MHRSGLVLRDLVADDFCEGIPNHLQQLLLKAGSQYDAKPCVASRYLRTLLCEHKRSG